MLAQASESSRIALPFERAETSQFRKFAMPVVEAVHSITSRHMFVQKTFTPCGECYECGARETKPVILWNI
jgi:hypothetical protein